VLFSANPEATERLRLYEAPLIRLPTWSPAGDEIAFLSNDGILYAIRPDGSGLRVITAELTMGVASLAWSPDGTRLALATFDGELYVVRADGGGLVQVAAQLEPLYDLDWRHTLNGPPQWSPWPVEP
jgi:Tol biopolymer transport system component